MLKLQWPNQSLNLTEPAVGDLDTREANSYYWTGHTTRGHGNRANAFRPPQLSSGPLAGAKRFIPNHSHYYRGNPYEITENTTFGNFFLIVLAFML